MDQNTNLTGIETYQLGWRKNDQDPYEISHSRRLYRLKGAKEEKLSITSQGLLALESLAKILFSGGLFCYSKIRER